MSQTRITDPVNELTSSRLTAVIQDAAEQTLAAADLDALTLTVWDQGSGTVIVDHRDILNIGGGTLDASGNLVVELEPDDMAIQNTSQELELHICLIEWTYDTTKKGRHEVIVQVNNLGQVT